MRATDLEGPAHVSVEDWAVALRLGRAREWSNAVGCSDVKRRDDAIMVHVMGAMAEILLFRAAERVGADTREARVNAYTPVGGWGHVGPDLSVGAEWFDAKMGWCHERKRYVAINAAKHKRLRAWKGVGHYYCVLSRAFGSLTHASVVPAKEVDAWSCGDLLGRGDRSYNREIDEFHGFKEVSSAPQFSYEEVAVAARTATVVFRAIEMFPRLPRPTSRRA